MTSLEVMLRKIFSYLLHNNRTLS